MMYINSPQDPGLSVGISRDFHLPPSSLYVAFKHNPEKDLPLPCVMATKLSLCFLMLQEEER